MAKYNFELKKKIVLEHLSLGVGSKALAKKYNVKSARQIQQWIHNYNEFGEEGLKRSRQKNNYSFEFKSNFLGSPHSTLCYFVVLLLRTGDPMPDIQHHSCSDSVFLHTQQVSVFVLESPVLVCFLLCHLLVFF